MSLRCLALLAFASLAALPQPASANEEICQLRFRPPDGTVEICFTCGNPPDSEAAAECDARCQDPSFRRANSSCAFRDEDKRRMQPCGDDERRDGTGACVPLNCEPDERAERGMCVPLDCAPGSLPMDGRCVKPRRMAQMQLPQCISPAELKEVSELTDDAETLTELTFTDIIALAAVRFQKATLPDGSTTLLPPGDLTPVGKRFAASVDKLLKPQGIMCEADVMLSCAEPLQQLVIKQRDAVLEIYKRLFAAIDKIEARPQYDACIRMGDAGIGRYLPIARRALAERMRLDLAGDYFRAIVEMKNSLEIICPNGADISQCGIQILPDPPFIPNKRAAQRKLKNPIPGLGLSLVEP